MKIPRLSWRIGALLSLCIASFELRAADAPAASPKQGYTVTVDIKVSETGDPEGITLVKTEDESTGDVLNKMALAMAMKTHFPPRLKDGVAVKYIARAPFFFPIEGDEGPAANNQPKPRGRGDVSVQPTYPPDMAERGEVGGVILEMVIDDKGDISRLTTLRASHPEFEKAARDALKTWKFHPAEKDGHPVETRWRIAVVFETPDKMAELEWRVAPRPNLGSFVVMRSNRPLESDEAKSKPEEAAPVAKPEVAPPLKP